jgi:hypothetical protein
MVINDRPANIGRPVAESKYAHLVSAVLHIVFL